jgi:hypothetical protein
MGILEKRREGRTDARVARAIAKRGIPGQATILALAATGRTRAGGAGREIVFTLRLDFGGSAREMAVTQFMNEVAVAGLAPGEAVNIMYDRDDPATIIVLHSPKT